ncbi:hypothetical protein CFP56_017270 [Quercus suber]|uniref:Uncharacterized protein n=1 Tax=Quercus suber TaxID=58331 RepID=A0AAW0KPV9_QUESU
MKNEGRQKNEEQSTNATNERSNTHPANDERRRRFHQTPTNPATPTAKHEEQRTNPANEEQTPGADPIRSDPIFSCSLFFVCWVAPGFARRCWGSSGFGQNRRLGSSAPAFVVCWLPTHLQAENSSSETPLLVVGTTARYMTAEVVTAHK